MIIGMYKKVLGGHCNFRTPLYLNTLDELNFKKLKIGLKKRPVSQESLFTVFFLSLILRFSTSVLLVLHDL